MKTFKIKINKYILVIIINMIVTTGLFLLIKFSQIFNGDFSFYTFIASLFLHILLFFFILKKRYKTPLLKEIYLYPWSNSILLLISYIYYIFKYPLFYVYLLGSDPVDSFIPNADLAHVYGSSKVIFLLLIVNIIFFIGLYIYNKIHNT
jgi:hypothetical protein